MRFKWIGTLAILAMCIYIPARSQARTAEWKNSDYNFKQVKTLLILQTDINPYVQNSFALKNTTDLLKKYLSERHIKYVDLDYVITAISQETKMNLEEIAKSDKEKYHRLLQEYGPKYIDAILKTYVFAYGWSTGDIEKDNSSGTWYKDHYYTKQILSVLNSSFSVPLTTHQYVCGTNAQTSNTGCEIVLYDARTLEKVWSYVGTQSDSSPNVIINVPTSPDQMMEQIISNAISNSPMHSGQSEFSK